MQRIAPFLWFNDDAEEATNFYVSIFQNAEVLGIQRHGDNVFTTSFRLAGLDFMALNGGPEYQITPAVSFFVNCETEQEIDDLWAKLAAGGQTLMPLDNYPFSDKYGWVSDRFGVSWQLSLDGKPQSIALFLLFVGAQYGKAEAAMTFYTSLFPDSRIVVKQPYGPGGEETAGAIQFAMFNLNGQPFMAMDSGHDHAFTFTEGTSLFINCRDQQEVDELWAKLTADGGEPGPCGWLKDKFGVSWQVIPAALGELMGDPDPIKANNVMQAMLKMGKIDVAKLQEAYDRAA